MKQLILGLFAIVFSVGFGMPEAEARRLGGGGSFGMQRQITPQAPRAPSAAPAPTQSPAGATPPKRSWMGPVAGLAAGLGLAALFSHLGLGEELASFVMIALLLFGALMLFRLLSRRSSATQAGSRVEFAGAGAGPIDRAATPALAGGVAAAASGLRPDFDAEAFVRQAKVHFIRLQAANDAGNLDDIRDFTTPEMFAEIRLQLADRGAAVQRTDVVELNGEVIEVAEEGSRYVVSVRFTGLLREDPAEAPAPFDEVWHLSRPMQGSTGWVIAGIQQVS